jgi:hypothetical protein
LIGIPKAAVQPFVDFHNFVLKQEARSPLDCRRAGFNGGLLMTVGNIPTT